MVPSNVTTFAGCHAGNEYATTFFIYAAIICCFYLARVAREDMNELHPLEIFRLDQQITRSNLAQKLGISASYMTRLLGRERSPGGELIARVERLTNGKITATDFFAEDAA